MTPFPPEKMLGFLNLFTAMSFEGFHETMGNNQADSKH